MCFSDMVSPVEKNFEKNSDGTHSTILQHHLAWLNKIQFGQVKDKFLVFLHDFFRVH